MSITIGLISLVLIGAIIWWFFGQHSVASEQAVATDGHQSATIVVKGGYSPQTVVLKKGVPATIDFDLKDSTACLSHVVFDQLGIDRDLAKDGHAKIEIPTDQAGDLNFACGMDMFHGKVVVK